MSNLNERAIVTTILDGAGVSSLNAQNIINVFRSLWKKNPVGLVNLLHNVPVVAGTKKTVKRVAKKVTKKTVNNKVIVTNKKVTGVKTATVGKKLKRKKNKNKKAKGVSLKKNTTHTNT